MGLGAVGESEIRSRIPFEGRRPVVGGYGLGVPFGDLPFIRSQIRHRGGPWTEQL